MARRQPDESTEPDGSGGGTPPTLEQPSPPAPTVTAPPKSLAERAAAGELLTPDELAQVTDNTFATRPLPQRGGGFPERGIAFSPAHSAAAICHGWLEHGNHSAEPFRLSREDYQHALEHALAGKAPHPPAMSPFTNAVHRAAADAAKESR